MYTKSSYTKLTENRIDKNEKKNNWEIAIGLNEVDNLREVQAFPTSASGIDNLMGSPSELTEQQLRELHIKIR